MPKATSSPEGGGNRPIHTARHRRLKATIWCNQTDKGAMYNVIVTRSYRDKGTQEWRDTHSIGYDDLMNVAALMHEAHSYISNRMGKEGAKSVKPARTTSKAPARPGPLAQTPSANRSPEDLPY